MLCDDPLKMKSELTLDSLPKFSNLIGDAESKNWELILDRRKIAINKFFIIRQIYLILSKSN